MKLNVVHSPEQPLTTPAYYCGREFIGCKKQSLFLTMELVILTLLLLLIIFSLICFCLKN